MLKNLQGHIPSLRSKVSENFQKSFIALTVAAVVLGGFFVAGSALAETLIVDKWAESSGPIFDPESKVYYPTIVKISDTSYQMWYGSNSGIGYASSSDGLSWTEVKNPVAELITNANHPQVEYADGKYVMWYWDGSQSIYSIKAIRYAESVDGQDWTDDQAITGNIISEKPGEWNGGSYGPMDIIYNSSAINEGDNPFDYSFVMYFDATTGGLEEIGLGYSVDGKDWRLYGKVLSRGGDGVWDSAYTTFGTVIKDNDRLWHMWYSGGQNDSNDGIGYAYSIDGLDWTRGSENPIFHQNDGISWRSERTYTPIVIRDGSVYKMWFSGAASGNYAMGYATNYAPFSTIQDAINAASSGDEINVAAGTYGESLTINKQLILLGANANIDPAGSADRENESIITGQVEFISGGDGSEFNGFKLDGDRIWIHGASDVTASYNIVSGSGAHGIVIDNSPNAVISYNTVDTSTWESIVTFSGSVGTEISYNAVSNSGKQGIVISSGCDATEIRQNTVTNPGEQGIINHGSSDVVISGNTVTGVTAEWVSIESDSHMGTGVQIIENSITGGSKGVNYRGGSGVNISHNEISGTTHEAIFSDTKATIQENTINGGQGITLGYYDAQSIESVVSGNVISDSDTWGIVVYDNHAKVSILDNIISDAAYDGIALYPVVVASADDKSAITGNTITATKYNGIAIYGRAYTEISNNVLTGSNYYGADGTGDWDYAGIHIQDEGGISAAFSTITGNIVSDGINGIQTWSDNVTITGNEIYGMGDTYADEKVYSGRTYKNSAILVGSNFGSGDFDPTGVVIEGNKIHNNYWGLFYSSDLTSGVVAKKNWWGTFSPTGIAAKISDNVSYEPYCAMADCSLIYNKIVVTGSLFANADMGIPTSTGATATSTPSVTFLSTATITVTDGGGESTVTIPEGVVITRTDGENLDTTLLTSSSVDSTSLAGLGTGVVAEGALQWGIENLGLEFDSAITISIFVGTDLNGQTLDIARSTSGIDGWTNDGISPTSCIVSDGLCTFEATKASYYAATSTSSPTPAPAGRRGGTSVEIVFLEEEAAVEEPEEILIPEPAEEVPESVVEEEIPSAPFTETEELLTPEEVTPFEEVAPPEETTSRKEAFVFSPIEVIPEQDLASLLLATLGVIRESAWMSITVIFCLAGLAVIGIREWELAIRRKRQ